MCPSAGSPGPMSSDGHSSSSCRHMHHHHHQPCGGGGGGGHHYPNVEMDEGGQPSPHPPHHQSGGGGGGYFNREDEPLTPHSHHSQAPHQHMLAPHEGGGGYFNREDEPLTPHSHHSQPPHQHMLAPHDASWEEVTSSLQLSIKEERYDPVYFSDPHTPPFTPDPRVLAELQQLQLGQYARNFTEAQVDYSSFLLLTAELLKDLGVDKIGP
ncbi:uncharacterized protein LOC125178518 [Hyalella azteca]|uniref:Uncharacterized protein LOC125178518 n=1 Tax=Hyalella azteca TaxID=294128 RepID=A0A979FMU8_HYAAZ|nr:uncharacterized protein LOC125178518 [Hyalella azteca]